MSTILVEKHQGFHLITLNRPDKLNSFNIEMHGALRQALEAAEGDKSCRSVILTGAGKGFCAGQDLGDRVMRDDSAPPDLGHTIETYYVPLVKHLRALPFPVICAVNGVAAGAGANITLACDIVIASENAKFIQAFAKLSLVPDAGGTYFLPRLVGEARARYLALTAEPLPAKKAEEWGMIAKCVPHEELMNEAIKLATHFAQAPTNGLKLTKYILDKSSTNTLEQQLDAERDTQREAGWHPDYREGVSAFMEKRSPQFRGRL
jgi:2-(1,2-epoxy-1,2-dihydrophenyl)acetyl-CoA isomerase